MNRTIKHQEAQDRSRDCRNHAQAPQEENGSGYTTLRARGGKAAVISQMGTSSALLVRSASQSSSVPRRLAARARPRQGPSPDRRAWFPPRVAPIARLRFRQGKQGQQDRSPRRLGHPYRFGLDNRAKARTSRHSSDGLHGSRDQTATASRARNRSKAGTCRPPRHRRVPAPSGLQRTVCSSAKRRSANVRAAGEMPDIARAAQASALPS